jgi:putative addiction module component (TIGR02574 family)
MAATPKDFGLGRLTLDERHALVHDLWTSISADPVPAMVKDLGLDRLTIDERIELAMDLWDSVASEAPQGYFMTEELKQELARRIAEADADAESVVPWEQVLAEAKARFHM